VGIRITTSASDDRTPGAHVASTAMPLRSRRLAYAIAVLLLASGVCSDLLAPSYLTDGSDVVLVGRWIFFPVMAASIVLLRRRGRWPGRRGYVYAVALAVVAALLALKPATVINANMGTVAEDADEGRIVEIAPPTRRLPARFVIVGENGDRHRWPMPEEAVRVARVGDWLHVRCRVGGLGIRYVLRDEAYWAVTRAQ
jgi:hypothetical protein